jgi:RNA polymerase sigma factor
MMQEEVLARLLADATSGNEIAREKIIRHYQPYIINTIGRISGRYLTWSDEEASIGLLAFNRAIDTYNDNGGRTFLNYVYLLINRDLIDYFRKESKQAHHLLPSFQEEDSSTNFLDVKTSMESFQQNSRATDLVEEILEFSETLKQFGIEFEDLEKYTPKHRDTKEMLLEIAGSFLNHPELIDEFLRKKRLPVKAFLTKTNYSIKTVERHRNYLVTLIVIRLHPEWRHLSQYIQIPVGSGSV